MFPVTSDRARVESRRKQGRRVLVASMAASAAIHAFVFSLGINPAAVKNGGVETAPTSRDPPLGIRITRIVVGERAAHLPRPPAKDIPKEDVGGLSCVLGAQTSLDPLPMVVVEILLLLVRQSS